MDKIMSALGLAKKAGKLETGTNSVLTVIRSKKAVLVLTASDISENTSKRIRDKTDFYNIDCELIPYTCEELGGMFGKKPCACVALTDKDFVRLYEHAKAKTGGISNGDGK